MSDLPDELFAAIDDATNVVVYALALIIGAGTTFGILGVWKLIELALWFFK